MGYSTFQNEMHLLRTFGRLALDRDGADVPGWDKHRTGPAILVILAVEGAASRDQVMALLWPESDSVHARGSLRQSLHQVRSLLNDFGVIRGDRTLSLDPAHIATDVTQFRAAMAAGDIRQAVALYQGPFLDGVHLGSSAEFEHWVDEQRVLLSREAMQAFRLLAREAALRNDPAAAAGVLERLRQLDPTDAAVVLDLMQAHASAGQHTAAYHAADQYLRSMHDGHGVTPDERISQLAARLRDTERRTRPESWATLPGSRASAPASPAETSVTGRRPRWAAAAVAALLLAGAAATATVRSSPRHQVEPSLVAIGPFEAADTTLLPVGEVIAAVLAGELDGAGPLRTVQGDPATHRSRAPLNRAAAAALGSRAGAGVVIYGDVKRLAGDSIAVNASILDQVAGDVVEVTTRGTESQASLLTDSLTVSIMNVLAMSRPIAASRRSGLSRSLGTLPLPAVREFLRGEQFLRRGDYDSALARYDQVLTMAPDHPLAMRRVSQVIGFGAAPQEGSRLLHPESLRERATLVPKSLAPRDSLLVLADSLGFAVFRATTLHDIQHNMAAMRATLETAARLYPRDPEVWYELGEALMHLQPPLRGSAREILAAFDQAIAADSAFSPAFEHTVELAFQLGEADRAATYLRAATRARPTHGGPAMYLTRLALDSGRGAFEQALGKASTRDRYFAGVQHLRWATDSAEIAVPALRLLATEGLRPDASDTAVWSRPLVMNLAFRGHLAAAGAAMHVDRTPGSMKRIAAVLDPLLELALFGALPDTIPQREFAQAFDPSLTWSGKPEAIPYRHLLGASWWFARRDTLSLKRLANRGYEMSQTGEPAVAAPRGRYLHAASIAWLALARGDSVEALHRFRAIPDSLCIVITCFYEKLMLARLELARGDAKAAVHVLDKWWDTAPPGPSAVFAVLIHARALDQAGNRDAARSRYQYVAEAWQQPDSSLQILVEEARRGAREVFGNARGR